jgi:SAM-dependent MidA family methyltransferase
MLEVSPELRARQQQVLQQAVPHLLPRIQWLDTLPDQINGLVLANELLDALPVRRFHIRDGQPYEQYVDWCDGLLCYRDQPLDDSRLRERVESLHLEGDYLSEVNFRAEDWTKTIGERLQKGVLLIIDYGFPRREYYHPQRNQGTLMCHYQHHSHPDPLILAGLQDITAHLDFTAIADAALATQLDVSGYTTQAHFVLDSGILDALQSDNETNPATQLQLANEVKRLTLPQEMGEIFKVMALTRQWDTMLPGFQQHDLRSRL